MYIQLVTVLCGLMAVKADFQQQNQNQGQFGGNTGFNNGGFNNGGFGDGGFNNNGFGDGFASMNIGFKNLAVQQKGQAQGNSAAAGNADAVGLGSASSINQADHQADQDNTASQSLSANTAQGTQGSSAGGAAQAGGQIQSAKQIQSSMGQQNGLQRFKRQFGNYAGDGGYGGFSLPQSLANANSLGGGSAQYGQVTTNNNAFSQTNPYGGFGFAAGNSAGQGQGVNIFQAANTNSQSGMFNGRRKRQSGFGGYNNGGYANYGFPQLQSSANGNSIGGGSALFGRVATNNNAFSQTNPYGAMGFAAGNSMGEGQGVNIFNAANTNANSGTFGR